jgi:uncharacterized protein (TIGR00296 family)
VTLARRTLERRLGGTAAEGSEDAPLPPEFDERRGTFVTLRRYPSGTLRGCIGFPRGVLPLRRGIPEAALAAAREDPRFRPVDASELGSLTVEVSILSVPEVIEGKAPAERLAAVKVGRDGLIIEGHGASGLLLPQVAPEQGWTERELLEGTCEKAGLPLDAWKDPRVRLLRFEARVFAESSPRGDVVELAPGA